MGCLQSYFRKGSYDVYEAHSTGLSPSPSSAAAAAVTSAKPTTPPGSNGHAPEGVEEDSPPPRPPPKKSHEAKAQAAAAAAAAVDETDPSQPPALPPKRHSKASSGSQSVKVEPQPGVEPGGTTSTKSDGSTAAEGSPAPTKVDSQDVSATPQPVSKEATSPTEAVTATPPQNDSLVSEATDTPGGTNSSDAVSPLKKDEVTTSPVAGGEENSNGEEIKSPCTGDAQDGSQMSTPGPMGTITPTSVVISPPDDEGGSLGEKISPLEEPPATPSTHVQEMSRDTPASRPQSTVNPPEVSITPPEDKPVEADKDDAPRPSSVVSKEMESTSMVSGSIVTDSAIVEGKESPSEATVRRSVVGQEEGAIASTEGKETPKGRDSGLSSNEGSTPMAVAQADHPAQGPATETSEARDVQGGDSLAAVQVSEEINKTESGEARSGSRPASAVVEKTDEKPASVEKCENVVTGDSNEGKEELAGGANDDVDGDKIGKEKSFGFGDSASQDTVVHVKTEGSTEIPNASSQEKASSPEEQPEMSQKSIEKMSDEKSAKEKVEEIIVTPSPEVKEVSEEEKKEPEVSSPPSEPIAPTSLNGSAPQSPTKQAEALSPPSPVISPPTSQDECPLPSPTQDNPSPPAGVENASVSEREQPISPVPQEPESSPPNSEIVVASVSEEKPTPASPVTEAPASQPAESASTVVKEEELPPLSPSKEPETSPPPSVGESAPVPQEEQGPASPSIEAKKELVSAVQEVPQMEEKPEVNEETAPESPRDKSEASSEEFPPPPPPEAEKETEQQISEAMPPPPPPEDMVAASTEVPQTEGLKSQERPLSATEEEVASILLGQTTVAEVTKKEESTKNEEEQKGLPPPPPAAQNGNAEEDFPPPPPDMTVDAEIQSPVDVDGRTRSASFELVEVLNLGGSLEEGEEGAGEGRELREGGGLVKRVPTPVNTDWPPSQEEEDEEEERASISPEATATPSVTPESKQSEEGEGAGPKLAKDAVSGSLEGISEVTSPRAEAKEEENPEKSAVQAAKVEEPKEIASSEEKIEEIKTSPTKNAEVDEPPVPSAPDEEVIVADEGKRIPGDIEVPECIVTNQGPPPEVLAALEGKLNAQVHENEEEERTKSSEEVRKEVEEVGRIEVEEVIKKAVVEAKRRDRESRMSGEVLDEDTVVVEAATNGHNGAPIEEDKGVKDVSSPKSPAATQVSGEVNEEADHEAVKSENHNETVEVSNDISKAADGDLQKFESPEADKLDQKAGKESPEVKVDAVSKASEEKTNGMNGSHEVSEDPAVMTKVKTPVKLKAEGEVNGEAKTEGTRRSAAQSGEARSPAEETIEAARSEAVEEAAAIKIQSTFRGYAVRRDAGRVGKGEGAGGDGGEGAGGRGDAGAAEGGDREPSETAVDESTRAQSDVPKSSEEDRGKSLTDGPEEEEDRKVWERLEEERRDQAASCIQRGFRDFRESGSGAKRLRREDALLDRTTSSSCEESGSSSSFQRTSGEFHDHVVLPPIVSADILARETGGMRQGCGVPADGSDGPQGDSGARGLMDSAAARIQAGYRGYRVRKRLREVQNNGTNNHRDSPNGQSDLSNGKEGEAATKIQAGVRGFLTRRRLKRRREDDCENQGVGGGEAEGHSVEVEKAAVKIQAGFRGYKGRQKAKARRQQDGKKEVK